MYVMYMSQVMHECFIMCDCTYVRYVRMCRAFVYVCIHVCNVCNNCLLCDFEYVVQLLYACNVFYACMLGVQVFVFMLCVCVCQATLCVYVCMYDLQFVMGVCWVSIYVLYVVCYV